jgi:hypothetical protein
MAPTMIEIEPPAIPSVMAFGFGRTHQQVVKIEVPVFQETSTLDTTVKEVFELVQEEISPVMETEVPIEPAIINEPIIAIREEEKIVFELSPIVEETPVEEVPTPQMIVETIDTSKDVQAELDALFNAPAQTFNTPMVEVEKTEQQMKDDYVTIKGITINRRKGSRLLTDSELEAEVNFELQKRAFDERASRLRSMSFNVNKADIDSDESNIPAFMRQNKVLDQHPSSSEDVYSDIKINSGSSNGSNISTLNTFLNGKNPD